MAIKINVSEFLGKRKMNQSELSKITGIRPATISALYHETIKRIEIEHINKLCKALECTSGELIEYIPE